jgi:hypothetical protein
MSLFALKEAANSLKHQQTAQCHDLQEHDLNFYKHKKLSLTSGIYLLYTQSLIYALVVFLKKCMSIKRDLLSSTILHSLVW